MTDELTFTTFSSALQGAFARVASLRARATERFAAEPLLLEALAELDCVQEELHTAEEELHSQADELSSARNALHVEQERYRELFETAPDAYIATDANGAIEDCNQRACELLNIAAAHVRRKPLSLFVGETDRQALRDLLTQLAHEPARRDASLELRVVPRHALTPRWVSISVSQVLGRFGRTRGLRWLLRDITDAKEQTLREEERYALLARQVEERNAELEAAKGLLQRYVEHDREARSLADRIAEQRERLLSVVAHELRSPLNAIASWNQLLMLDSASASLRERGYGIIARNVQRLARLIEDLLDHQRAEHGSLKLEREIVDLLPLLNTVLEDHALGAEIKGVQLSLLAQADSARIVGDASRIQQVLNNLLGNALKFTPNGGAVRVEVSCPGSTVEIRVIDSGRGIPTDELPKIFGAFVQLGARAGNPGLGLGLSIARHLVTLHGGSITAHSAGPGRGSLFSLILPLAAQ